MFQKAFRLISIGILLFLASCQVQHDSAAANAVRGDGETVELRSPFGIAVKEDGRFYVAELDAARISKFSADGELVGVIQHIAGYGPLVRPFDIEVCANGNLYIVDNGANCVLVLDADERLILKIGSGTATAEPGGFNGPHFLHVNTQRKIIYIADTHNDRIQIFDFDGNLVKILGGSGFREAGNYHFSVGVTEDSAGNLYAMNWSGGYINVYDSNWNIRQTIGQRGGGPVEFNDAYSVVYSNNSLWVADTYNNRLLQLTLDGQPISIVGGTEGQDIHQFSHPTDLDFDGEGNIYVADWKNNRVIKLDQSGHFLRQWGGLDVSMNYQPPYVAERNICRGPLETGIYSGLDTKTIDLAAKNSVDWLFPSFDNQSGNWNIERQVAYAHKQGIKVAPSIAVAYLGSGHSQWKDQPQYYMGKKGSTRPDGRLSYYWPEIRTWRAQHIAEQALISGVDGILLDYIRYPDAVSGYEPAMVHAFEQQTGKNAADLAADDPAWLEFRAKYITKFIAELRYELARRNLSVRLSVYVGPDWQSDLEMVLRNWRHWVQMGIVDELCLGIYTRDFQAIYEGVKMARKDCPENVTVNAMIACWGGNLNTPEMLKKGADVAFAAGADMVSIYRIDTIYDRNLWPAIGQIADNHKK